MFTEQINFLNMFSDAGLMVKVVLLLLLLFSVASWAIIFVKYRYMRKAFHESADFTDYFWKSRDFSDAFVKAKQLQGSPIAKIFRIGYTELKRVSRPGENPDANGAHRVGLDNVKRSLRRAADTEITRMTQMIPFLATAGNTAPFIGLFGTVWGIMSSFHGIGMRGSASLAVVAPGISEALVATAAGLAVAIPAVIAYNYFTHKIRVLESELQSFSADFLNIIERDLISPQGGRP